MYAIYTRSLGGMAKEYLAQGESHILDMQFSFHKYSTFLFPQIRT